MTLITRLLHFDGSTWAQLDLDFWGTVSGIWGAAPDDIWLVGHIAAEGNDTLIIHWDGTSLETVMDGYPYYDPESSMAPTYALREAWGYGRNSVFATGATSAYYNGEDWKIISGAYGSGIYGESKSDTLVFEEHGGVKRVSCQ